MSDDITIEFKEIDVGEHVIARDYWNDRIREMQKSHEPLILWITKQVMKELEE